MHADVLLLQHLQCFSQEMTGVNGLKNAFRVSLKKRGKMLNQIGLFL